MGKSLLVLGAQWGDEGKGKITNYLSEKADVVVRYQGGNNAGHTIVFGGHKYALQTIPSGVFNPDIQCVLGNGMVVNPRSFLEERQRLIDAGYPCKNIYISDRCHVLFDHHIVLDALNEAALKENKIGTTKKGIGPCYTDKIARSGMRMVDFVGPDFEEEYKNLLEMKNAQIVSMGGTPVDYEKTVKEYKAIADEIRPLVHDTVSLLQNARKEGKKILFEGAQGSMLDIDFGSYPYVTSSNVTAGGTISGSGVGIHGLDEVLGIVKAYETRVGEGVFPTELKNEIGDLIREKGHEYGVVTHRPRRTGWLDLVALNYAIAVSGITSICLTLLDVLTGFDEIKVCTSYTCEGETVNTVPASNIKFGKCVPVYETFPGWKEDISDVRSFEELPVNAQNYIRFIEKKIGVPVSIFSVGPDKTQTIVLQDIF